MDQIELAKPQRAGRGRPFGRGQSGNPEGRPPGARNRKTLAAAMLLDGEVEALTRKAVELALAGDRWTFSPRA
jgi:ribulose 1,5-bisphosphate carboxylase large subunit-like protein